MNPQRSLLQEARRCLEAMEVETALALFYRSERAEGADPDECGGGRWVCHMLRGDFEAAWRESDGISQRGKPDPHRFWDGRSLAGKRTLIRCLHGLGDTLQFIRYAPLLRQNARSVVIEAQPALKRLLAASSLADAVITWGEAEGQWESQIEVVELPRIFQTSLHSIPRDVPYLQTGAADAIETGGRSRLPRVGLLWHASNYNPARSVPAPELEELLTLRGIEFFNLQAGSERFALNGAAAVHDDADDILDTARKLQQLDLMITVDTMMAHLAGALAKPVWTLLPFQCDWRWMLERSDSPWYPSMRLIRQNSPGDWRGVIARVRADLATFATSFEEPGQHCITRASPAMAAAREG